MAEKVNKDAVYRAAKPKKKDCTINDDGGLDLLENTVALSCGGLSTDLMENKIGLALGHIQTLRWKPHDERTKKLALKSPTARIQAKLKKQAKQATQIDAENVSRKATGLPIINGFEYAVREWLTSIEHLTSSTT